MSVVMVTGASAGVGRAIVRRFAQEGAQIGLMARGIDRLETAAREVRAGGGEALVLPLDVANAEAVDAAAEAMERRFGPIDVWINVAMVTVMAPVSEMTAAEYRRVTEVTYLGCVHGTLAALKRMRPRNRGMIIQIGSALAYRSIPLQSAYCAAKHAVIGFTDSLRSELIHDGSRVHLTVMQLPAVNTPQFDWARNKLPRRPQPLPPIFEPELIAEAVFHAASNPRREYWLGWPTVKAIIGERLVPGLADRILATEAWDGQMTAEPARERPDNLYEPVPGDYAARGRFSDRASSRSPAIWASEHRQAASLAAGIGLAALAGAGLAMSLSSRPRH
ncbi:SDR family NAD(P)-dependent oxidoreductase [Paracoccus sp. S-4012]|uniref:SDR family oxidoreductase n=1 Tax=Paracoccus sp. S-4012 TaxID=2665648 RepID=UPI0012AF44BF|nr:SDR family oxidoreductase [Paracoccus sp. S-4012]MRX49939.1 SDR family NAD(P)-dependent oxidoreductase [Paracoccus sp. S-4012]